MTLRVGLDLGGSKLLMVAEGRDGRVVARVPTGPSFDGPALQAAIEDFMAALGERPAAVGLAVPGLVGSGPLLQACDVLPALVGWRPAAPFASGPPIMMVNDAEAALFEECHDAPAEATAAVVMAGTGIGAAVLAHGRPLRGANGWAGELGSIPLAAGAESVRTLDELASGAALTKRLRLDGGAVRARIEAGDEVVLRAVGEAGAALGLGLATLIDLVNPALLALGGGLLDLPVYLEAALATAERHTLPDLWKACEVRKVRAGELVAALGAARWAARERTALRRR